MLDRVVLDTNVLIRHRLKIIPGRSYLSAVVLQEITAGAGDAAQVRYWGMTKDSLQEEGRFLLPDADDWFHAGKVLNSLHRGLPSRRSRVPVAIDKGEQQRLLRDVLLARSAKRVNAAVVTYNAGDFEKIRRFCDVRVVDPVEFL